MINERGCRAVGIDLGTTYSSLAYLDSQLTPRIVCDNSGQAVTSSIVYFDGNEVLVGDSALQQSKADVGSAVQLIKRHMGDRWRKTIGNHEHSPESISALILRHLIQEAESQIGEVSSAVITVPAYFTERRRAATQQAGELAGLNVLGTLNEPMAATLAYGFNNGNKEMNVVVYDLGGGTFDVTVVKATPTQLVELSTNGNRQLGGRDWDQALTDYVCREFRTQMGRDPKDNDQAIHDLWIECEQAKRHLTRRRKVTIRCNAFGKSMQLEVTREKFESLTQHLLQSTILTAEMAIDDAGLTWSDIDKIVLVGGSTHMPAVSELLRNESGLEPEHGINPVLAVALGAAIYAHSLESGVGITTHVERKVEAVDHDATADMPEAELFPSAPDVRFVTAHGVGVKVRVDDKWKNQVLIPRNTQVPVSVTKRFKTLGASGKSTIRVAITQGDSLDVDLAETVGTGSISGLPNHEESGNPVDVTMEFDSQGRLDTRAVYVKTGQAMQMSLDLQGALQRDELDNHREFMLQAGDVSISDEVLDKLKSTDDDDSLPLIQPE